MAIKSNPTQWVNSWKAGVGAKGANYVAGVQASTDWAAAATNPAAVNARNANWNAAANSGAIERGIQNVGTAGWRSATIAKAQNWQTGVNSPAAQQNALSGANKLFSFLSGAENAISQLPRGGYQENKARANAWMDSMHQQAQAAKGL